MRKLLRTDGLVLFLILFIGSLFLSFTDSNKPQVNKDKHLLRVSDNNRYLVKNDGTPFFYLGDTAWELFHRLNREEADRYLEDRAKKGFTVIQAVALAENDGDTDPNAYGHLPFIDRDPSQPALKEGPANDYWDHVDYIVDKANELGLYIGFLPTWGRYWRDDGLFTVKNAAEYGEWLGKRYGEKGIIWITGGDRVITDVSQEKIIISMAKGIRKGDNGRNLITYHPRGRGSSAENFHYENWLDFNMQQTGHRDQYSNRYHEENPDANGPIHVDYKRIPIKPVIDGEPLYEDHPLPSFEPRVSGTSIASDVRRKLYWNLFDGAFGHTYGHHSIWQMWAEDMRPIFRGGDERPLGINSPLMPWYEALDQPGAGQMQYGRKLIESRPFLTRIPDSSIIVTDRVPRSVPGRGRYKFVATRDIDGTYAMVYVPVGRSFIVNMDVIKGEKVKAWWFNPRNGEATEIGVFDNKGERNFNPPDPGEALDWILVLDDFSKNYSAPGKERFD